MIKRAEDQEGKHIGEDKLGALKGKGSLEGQKAGGKQSRGSESLFSLSQSPVSHYLTEKKRRSRIDERNMGNESHKEDRNAYPIRHCTRTFFCCECRLSAAYYLTKGRKRTPRHCVKFTSASAEITVWIRGLRMSERKWQWKAVCLYEGWAAFLCATLFIWNLGQMPVGLLGQNTVLLEQQRVHFVHL